MRILILHSRYLSGDASGENRVAEDEARLLQDAGHEVSVWSPSPDVGSRAARARTGVSAVWSTEAGAKVKRMIRSGRVEIAHAHNLFPVLSPVVLRSARETGAAVLVTLHNYRLLCLPADLLRNGRVCEACVGRVPWRGVYYRCYRGSTLGSAALAASLTAHRGLRTFDGVTRYLAVSEFVMRKHVEAETIPRQLITVKPNFSWPAPAREGPGEYFLFVGRLAPEKGIDTLLSAWGRRPPGRLVIVGDGPEGSRLRGAAPEGVEFRGSLAASDVPAVIARARALMIPSRWYEAAPRTIIEAYAAGVPVLATNIGALPETVEDGVTGYLVPPEDAAAWADVVERLTDDRESERLGEGAQRRWLRLHSPERGLEGLESAYREALAAD